MTTLDTHQTDGDCTHHIRAIVTITVRECGACDLLVLATDSDTDSVLIKALDRIRSNTPAHSKAN